MEWIFESWNLRWRVFEYSGVPILILVRTTLRFWDDGESGRLPIHSSLSLENREYLAHHGKRQRDNMKRNRDWDIM
jgi:hypothetical protein